MQGDKVKDLGVGKRWICFVTIFKAFFVYLEQSWVKTWLDNYISLEVSLSHFPGFHKRAQESLVSLEQWFQYVQAH